ncbi:PilZ domain-containing protein [Trichlorobacter lovleyi]|uniref:PilZ domain-containing protein n=1 Tax=Trichlorobacter lovleyi TaxID=313985 RepID=UPI0022403E5F|nr:PilZ domain-containing protein [Trichlorobacter lovleyi]QOX77422.1 PilZ domain-containing protein [Trichlorobacter lovleyi]
MADKRNNDRKRRRIALCFGTDEAASRRAFTEDLSPLGLFIKTANVCNPNTVLRIELLVDDQPISFDARVMWAKRVPQNLFHLVKKCGMGVRIIRFHNGRDRYMGLCHVPEPLPQGGATHV